MVPRGSPAVGPGRGVTPRSRTLHHNSSNAAHSSLGLVVAGTRFPGPGRMTRMAGQGASPSATRGPGSTVRGSGSRDADVGRDDRAAPVRHGPVVGLGDRPPPGPGLLTSARLRTSSPGVAVAKGGAGPAPRPPPRPGALRQAGTVVQRIFNRARVWYGWFQEYGRRVVRTTPLPGPQGGRAGRPPVGARRRRSGPRDAPSRAGRWRRACRSTPSRRPWGTRTRGCWSGSTGARPRSNSRRSWLGRWV